MSTVESVRKESETLRPIMIEDTRLARAYSVVEVAKIAAGCIGDSPDARIEEALDLLSAAERHAFKDKWEKHREWNIKHGHSKDIEPEKKFIESAAHRYRKAEEVCSGAFRDSKTGKIKRTSLVAEAYEVAGIGRDKDAANRVYRAWLESAAIKEAHEIPFELLNKRFGAPPWEPEKFKQLLEERVSAASADSFSARLESGKKIPLIHDDQTAKDLVFDFLEWLEARPKKARSKTIRSSDTGKIVSPKNRGSAIADGTERGTAKSGKARKPGQYKPTKKHDVEEDAKILIPNRKKFLEP